MNKILKVAALGIILLLLVNQIPKMLEDNTTQQYEKPAQEVQDIKENRLSEILSDGVVGENELYEYEQLTGTSN